MLNPSTADEVKNDPTVERCEVRARTTGYGGLIVVNIFAWRSTDPNALYKLDDPIGPENDDAIRWAALNSEMVVCGWGTHAGRLGARGREVKAILDKARPGCAHALQVNADGSPKHPLYIAYSKLPRPF